MTQFDESKHNRERDGRFAPKPHLEADGVNLTATALLPAGVVERINQGRATEADEETVFVAFQAQLPENLSLATLNPDTALEPEHIDPYLAGDATTFNEHLDDLTEQALWHKDGHLSRAALSLGLDRAALSPDLERDLETLIRDRDTLNAATTLLNNTGNILMRYDVPTPTFWAKDAPLAVKAREHRDEPGVAQARATLVEQQLLTTGMIDEPLNADDKQRLTKAFENGPLRIGKTTKVSVVFDANPQVANLPLTADTGIDPNQVIRTIQTADTGKWDNTGLVIFDSNTDEGYAAPLSVPIKMPLTRRNHAKVDSVGGGAPHGWSDVEGMSYSNWTTTITDAV